MPPKKYKFQHIHVSWEYHVGMLEYTDQFKQRFCMSWQMFNDLVDELRVPLTVSYVQAIRSTSGNNPIYLEVIVPTGLRILGPSDPLNNVPTTMASLFPHLSVFLICFSMLSITMRPVVQ